MKVIYISGPITNNPDYERDFNRMENELQVKGFTVLNPAKLPQGLSNAKANCIRLAMVDAADAMVILPKWDRSQSAQLEVDYCRYVGKPVYLSLEGLLKDKEGRS